MGDENNGELSSKDLAALGKQLSGLNRSAELAAAMSKSVSPITEVVAAAKANASRLADIGKPPAELTRVMDAIKMQQDRISAFRSPISEHKHEDLIYPTLGVSPDVELPEIPPNPAYETNDRLERIERRFDEMHQVAVSSAKIATDLQAFAATFLGEFKTAAERNDRSARVAIWLGIGAVLFALAMPAIQIAYTEFWRVPADAAATQAALNELRTDIVELQTTQQEAMELLSESLESTNGELTTVLRELHGILAAPIGANEIEAAPPQP